MRGRRPEDNPFWVLELPPSATRLEARRAADKLLGLLAISAGNAGTYRTPLGPRPRDEAKVRAALAALDDSEQRVLDELWAEAPVVSTAPSEPAEWREAFDSLAWGVPRPCTRG